MDLTDQFAARLRELRIAAGLTQGELAEKAKLNQSAVSQLEQARRSPMWETVVTLAAALEVDIREFQKPVQESAPARRGRPIAAKPAKDAAPPDAAAESKPRPAKSKRKNPRGDAMPRG